MTELNIENELTKARIQLLLNMPFYGNLALHLKLKEMDAMQEAYVKSMGSIPTICTDGKALYYNKEFIQSLLGSSTSPKNKNLQMILVHELCHIIFQHFSRMQERHPVRWQFATDFATNLIVCKEFGKILEGMLYNEKYNNMTAEAIYNKFPDMNNGEGRNGRSIQGKKSKKGDKGGKGEKGEQLGQDGKEGKGLQEKRGYAKYSNDNITIEIDENGNITVDGEDVKVYDNHREIQGSKDEINELEEDWKIQVSKAYQQAKMAGKKPAGMDIFIEELLQPKLDWRTMMRQFIISSAKSDYSWIPPNRKFVHMDMYMPSLTGESLGDVVCIVDNSGSTISEQQRFFSEVNGLLQQYDVNFHLIVCDIAINSYKVYHQGDKIDLKYKGGGCTDLNLALDMVQRENINPTVCVILTDGYWNLPKKEPHYPVLWVLCKDSVELDKIPFGLKVEMTN